MRVLVAVKQIMAPETRLRIDEAGRRVVPAGPLTHWLNRFDEFAVEAAIRLKESRPGVEVDVATVGPERAAKVLERAVGMGADRGRHLLIEPDRDPGPWAVASHLAGLAGDYDLVICGAMSEDEMNGQTGPMLARLLGRPWATCVMALEVSIDGRVIAVEREIEGGRRDRLEIDLPALITVQSGLNRPRYPSLSNVLRAKAQPPEVISVGRRDVAREEVVSVSLPVKTRAALVLEGDTLAKAERLRDILKEKALI
ncbi:MAG: electron transfer flavoprotein subunit beta/FixA family protein [Proteobacteria bacterium]|nr:electron transfer flavoprotein subunit beta/FixA family protein [Pseudomonadota bacterium]MBU1741264.1 electron transfer flavoprotein subunit beta/FixA family protein [Pseudomonadota bacterium]